MWPKCGNTVKTNKSANLFKLSDWTTIFFLCSAVNVTLISYNWRALHVYIRVLRNFKIYIILSNCCQILRNKQCVNSSKNVFRSYAKKVGNLMKTGQNSFFPCLFSSSNPRFLCRTAKHIRISYTPFIVWNLATLSWN